MQGFESDEPVRKEARWVKTTERFEDEFMRDSVVGGFWRMALEVGSILISSLSDVTAIQSSMSLDSYSKQYLKSEQDTQSMTLPRSIISDRVSYFYTVCSRLANPDVVISVDWSQAYCTLNNCNQSSHLIIHLIHDSTINSDGSQEIIYHKVTEIMRNILLSPKREVSLRVKIISKSIASTNAREQFYPTLYANFFC